MTFDEISEQLLQKKNCSIRCRLGFIQDLHRFVYTDIELVNSYPDPSRSEQCKVIKQNLLYLLTEYDNLKKGVPQSKSFL